MWVSVVYMCVCMHILACVGTYSSACLHAHVYVHESLRLIFSLMLSTLCTEAGHLPVLRVLANQLVQGSCLHHVYLVFPCVLGIQPSSHYYISALPPEPSPQPPGFILFKGTKDKVLFWLSILNRGPIMERKPWKQEARAGSRLIKCHQHCWKQRANWKWAEVINPQSPQCQQWHDSSSKTPTPRGSINFTNNNIN